MRTLRLFLVLSFAALLFAPTPALAFTGTGGGFVFTEDGPVLTTHLSVSAPGSSGNRAYTDDSTDAPSPIRYEVVPVLVSNVMAPGVVYCGPGGTEADPANPWGVWIAVAAIDTATGEEIGRSGECVPVDPADPTATPTPTLPRPPSIVEIWRAVGIPAPGLHTSPAAEGVTGLETWLWSDGPTEQTISVTLDGWTLTGTARLTRWNYDPGDGTGAITATAQGTGEDDRAAAHTYEVKGLYDLSVTATWEADITLSGHGIAPRPVDIGTAHLTTTRPYRVVEIRGVLIP